MSRSVGNKGLVQVEWGTTQYTSSRLTSVSNPSNKVNKRFYSSATQFTAKEEPTVCPEGVIQGMSISASEAANSFNVSSGKFYLGSTTSITYVAQNDIGGITRPTVNGNVLVNAICVNSSGTISVVAGTEGTSSTARGAAGGPPYIPASRICIGYVNAIYTASSAGAVLTSQEIDSDSKEYSHTPGYKVIYFDAANDDNPDGTNRGAIEFRTTLEAIHTGDTTKGVYATYKGVSTWEEIPDAKDFTTDEPLSTYSSQAYDDDAPVKATGIEEWSGGFDYYRNKAVSTLWDKIQKNAASRKRWFRFYYDRNDTEYSTGIGIISISTSNPVTDMASGSASIEGDGRLYRVSS